MNKQNAVKSPQTTAKRPQIEFIVVNDLNRQVDELLTARPEPCPVETKAVRQVKTAQIHNVKTVVIDPDIIEQIQTAIQTAKPFVRQVTKGMTTAIRVISYMTGFVVVNMVKYFFIFAGAIVGGLIMALVDVFKNASTKDFEEFEFDSYDFEEPASVESVNNTINVKASGQSTVNIQINNK